MSQTYCSTQYGGNLNHRLDCIQIITTEWLRVRHMTPELNLKTNQGVSDYAGALALHFNYRSTSDEAEVRLAAKSWLVKRRHECGRAAVFKNRREYYLPSLLFHYYFIISSGSSEFHVTGPHGLCLNRSTSGKDSPKCYYTSIGTLFIHHAQLAAFGLSIQKKRENNQIHEKGAKTN